MSDQYEDLQQSYGRCLRDKHFIERFYQTFLASSPAIPPMFQTTDFNKQRMALRRVGHEVVGRSVRKGGVNVGGHATCGFCGRCTVRGRWGWGESWARHCLPKLACTVIHNPASVNTFL